MAQFMRPVPVPTSGLATIAPFGFSFDPVRMLCAYRRLGVTTCQYFRNMENPPTTAQATRAAAEAGVRFDSIHGVFGADIDPSSPSAEHRRACLKIYEDEGRLARDLCGAAVDGARGAGGGGLGGPGVVVHPAGWTPRRANLSRAEAVDSQRYRRPMLGEFLRRLAEIGERLGVVYLIENQPFNCYTGFDPVQLAEDVLAVGSSRIRMCLDTGHAHVVTGDVVGAIRGAGPAIAYFHVHDNDGVSDDHRMPGDGTIDWALVSGAMRDAAPAAVRMLEVFYEEARVEVMEQNGLGQRLGHLFM